MKRLVSFVIMLCLLLGMLGLAALAEEYYVQTQEDFVKVLAEAEDNSTIRLAQGVYEMPAYVSAVNITVIGAGESNTKIDFPSDYVDNSGIAFEAVSLDRPVGAAAFSGGTDSRPASTGGAFVPFMGAPAPEAKGADVAQNTRTGMKYASIQEAVNAAESDDTIKVIADHGVDASAWSCNGLETIIGVEDKSITIDLAGCKVSVDMQGQICNSFMMVTNGSLTLLDSGSKGSIDVLNGDNTKYMMYCETDGSMKVESGSYSSVALADSMIYSKGNKIVEITGGNFYLGNLGTGKNDSPWIFNASGQNDQHVFVSGGTFNADVFNQHYRHEVQQPNEEDPNTAVTLRNNGDGTYTCVPAGVAQYEWEGGYGYFAGYETLDAAIDAANKKGLHTKEHEFANDLHTIINDTRLDKSATATYTIVVSDGKKVSLDLGDNTLSTNGPIIIGSGSLLTVKGGEGTINSGADSIEDLFKNDSGEALSRNNVQIAGGVWSFDPSDYLASGFEVVQNEDGKWEVILAVGRSNAVPATGDMSNMPLWCGLLLAFAAVTVLTRKKKA